MIGGILAGIGVTALIFFVVWLLKNGSSPTPAVYALLIVSLIVFCIEGIWMVKAIKAYRNIDRTMILVQETVMSCLPEQGDNSVIQPSQEAAVRLGLGLLVPSAADMIEENGLAGRTVEEGLDVIRQSVVVSVSRWKKKAVWTFVITAVVLGVLMYVVYGIGSGNMGSRKSYGATGDSSFGTDYLNF